MSLLKQVSGRCFAQKCGVSLFDIDNEEFMKNQLDYQAEHLPLAVQELAALSLLSSSIIISQMQDAIKRVERLRIAESMLLPTEADAVARMP